jgi:hypothetical protein
MTAKPTRVEILCGLLKIDPPDPDALAEVTGCEPERLEVHNAVDTGLHSRFVGGWFAARTCSIEHNRAVNFPNHQGDYDFWTGFARGQELKLKGI